MKSNGMKNFVLLGAIVLGIVPLSGCGHYTTQRTSNILTYLYPGETQPVEVPRISPRLLCLISRFLLHSVLLLFLSPEQLRAEETARLSH